MGKHQLGRAPFVKDGAHNRLGVLDVFHDPRRRRHAPTGLLGTRTVRRRHHGSAQSIVARRLPNWPP